MVLIKNEGTDNLDKDNSSIGENRKSRRKAKKRLTVGSVIKNILFVIFILILSVLIYSSVKSVITKKASVLGYQSYIVMSGSMGPTFDTGSLIIVKPAKAAAIKERDIITFSSKVSPDDLTTHRVVKIIKGNEISFTTRGDANQTDDPNPVYESQLVGRVVLYIPYLGYLMRFLRTPYGLITLAFAGFVIILISEIKTKKNNKEKKEEEI